MAPKRRGRPRKSDKLVDDEVEKQEPSVSAEPAEAAEEVLEEDVKEDTEPSPKKAKVEEKKKRGRPKAASKKIVLATKKAVSNDVRDSGEDEGEEAAEDVEEEASADAKSEKVVIIEASKECMCFKTRAAKVQTGLTKAIPGIEVLINPDKPRKGCFEVRSKDGNIYMSLLGLPRPFTKLKSLDMDKAVEDIIAKVK